MKKNVKRSTVISLICMILLTISGFTCGIRANNVSLIDKAYLESKFTNTLFKNDTSERVDSIRYKFLRGRLIQEVDEFIRKDFPQAPEYLADYIVDNGLKHDLDICFMMTQTQIETGYGTAGIGRNTSRRSLFGVMGRRYDDYDSAINDYCMLLKRSYLGDRRTTDDLMKNYVTLSGYRYCVKRDYESKFQRQYDVIKRKTDIFDLQRKIRS